MTVEGVDGAASIAVEDNGVGLPKAERHRLTEPYMTTRAKGTGLGLAIVKKVVEEHGGALYFDDCDALGPTGARRQRDIAARRSGQAFDSGGGGRVSIGMGRVV